MLTLEVDSERPTRVHLESALRGLFELIGWQLTHNRGAGPVWIKWYIYM